MSLKEVEMREERKERLRVGRERRQKGMEECPVCSAELKGS
jgi:hypothetical protein